MKRLSLSIGGAALALLVLAGGAVAADPTATPPGAQARTHDTIPTALGLTQAEVMALRQDGLSLAQIAERQNVDPQKLVDALMEQWTVRINARLGYGAITAETATSLKAQLETHAKDMVYKVTLGGMRGIAVGAGPMGAGQGAAAMGQGRGMGMGRGTGGDAGAGTRPCDGTGRAAAGSQ
jgi:hypothetical protein